MSFCGGSEVGVDGVSVSWEPNAPLLLSCTVSPSLSQRRGRRPGVCSYLFLPESTMILPQAFVCAGKDAA